MSPQHLNSDPDFKAELEKNHSRVGDELREVRERLRWQLSDIAGELRIKEIYLAAIEHGDLEALPGPAYQVGFVRTYARALGLDGDEILRRFRAEGASAGKTPELSFPAPVPDRAVPSGAIVLLGVTVLLIGYGFWFFHTERERRLAASVPPVPATLAPFAAESAEKKLPPTKPEKALTAASKTPGLAGPPASPAVPPASPVVPAPASVPSGTVTSVSPPVPSQTAAPPAPAPAPGEVILATADSWVEVKDASGAVLFNRLMHSGDRWPVPNQPGLTMTVGNAGGTEISDNGAGGQPLGPTGAVIPKFALTSPAASPASPALPLGAR
jgi:cytoskeleton protein RodZ